MIFHPLDTDIPLPPKFTYPFCYSPHPLCRLAVERVRGLIESSSDEFRREVDRGKMFGVLVCESPDGRVGFLSAYSGQIAGRMDYEGFVPAVFDYLDPEGYFLSSGRVVTELGLRIAELRESERLAAARDALREAEHEARSLVDSALERRRCAKLKRDERRRVGRVSAEDVAEMNRESAFLKAEVKRVRRAAGEMVEDARAALRVVEQPLTALQNKQSEMSDRLMSWLFEHFIMLNARGERKNLIEIFETTPQKTPPAGSGECCAPKLLQWAYVNGYRPRAMAEFWWGSDSASGFRRHLCFYPSCTGKCLPILEHMLQGLDVEPNPLDVPVHEDLKVVFCDDLIAVVDKPSGMLSVPGRRTDVSAEIILSQQLGRSVKMVHRLDMDTSGLLVAALDDGVFRELQDLFAARRVVKRYRAVVEGDVVCREGEISLPLSSDFMHRPMQRVDYENGKPAATRFRVVQRRGRRSVLDLWPITGRTHQLRVHCAHPDGLGCPIKGDRLYGRGHGDLCLRAVYISFQLRGRHYEFELPGSEG